MLLSIIKILFGSRIAGWFGEHYTKDALGELPDDKYKIINDVFIIVDGRTCQIDHIVVF